MGSLYGLEMESNVGRDVLSTATAFGNLPKVVAEYASNSIDAAEDGQAVNVTVSKRRAYGANRIVIEDDARGMDDTAGAPPWTIVESHPPRAEPARSGYPPTVPDSARCSRSTAATAPTRRRARSAGTSTADAARPASNCGGTGMRPATRHTDD